MRLVSGRALAWFQVYLSNRSQCFAFGDGISDTFQLTCGLMPRTTPLHPTLHASKLFQVIKKHFPTAHTYADCMQQLLSFKLKSNAKEKECQWRLDVDPDVDLLCAVFTCQTFSWPLDFWWMFLPVSWLWCFYIWLYSMGIIEISRYFCVVKDMLCYLNKKDYDIHCRRVGCRFTRIAASVFL